MPTYDYQCNKCEYRFEQFQSITEKPISKCPKCGGKPRRLIGTGAGIIFKGSGFYQTDYRSESYKKKAEAENKTTCNGPCADTKSKPAAKCDPKKS